MRSRLRRTLLHSMSSRKRAAPTTARTRACASVAAQSPESTLASRAETLVQLEIMLLRSLAEADDLDSALAVVVRVTSELARFSCGIYWAVDEHGRRMRRAARHGVPARRSAKARCRPIGSHVDDEGAVSLREPVESESRFASTMALAAIAPAPFGTSRIPTTSSLSERESRTRPTPSEILRANGCVELQGPIGPQDLSAGECEAILRDRR